MDTLYDGSPQMYIIPEFVVGSLRLEPFLKKEVFQFPLLKSVHNVANNHIGA
jgi:hypothetical protein